MNDKSIQNLWKELGEPLHGPIIGFPPSLIYEYHLQTSLKEELRVAILEPLEDIRSYATSLRHSLREHTPRIYYDT